MRALRTSTQLRTFSPLRQTAATAVTTTPSVESIINQDIVDERIFNSVSYCTNSRDHHLSPAQVERLKTYMKLKECV
ncbi:hypothetical protein JL09_g5564 [Pichia kudriavzevii]|uniref:Uncharacterized protein n=1 Tax=Pichia kudriavzevii TaxID=4909 RepID=A0A099NTS6_PICKU|nr:hypothetical protein JL09_g5564 [Pichia kudriavzevii]